jgi:biotin transport system permease protein
MGSLYSDQPTWLHSVPAGLKLLALALLGIGLFAAQQWQVLLVATLVCVLVFASLGVATLRAKPLVVGVMVASALVAGFHVWMAQPLMAAVTVMRLLSATLMGIALTLTTRYSDLLHVFEWLLSPLQKLGVRTDRLALQLALMLRFTEQFFVVWRRLDESYRLRTGKAGGFKILAPLTIHMLVTARRVADTLHLRLRR